MNTVILTVLSRIERHPCLGVIIYMHLENTQSLLLNYAGLKKSMV